MGAGSSDHVAIVGGGLAGARAAQALRAAGFDGTVELIGDEAHLPYDRPPLSKEVLVGGWEPSRCLLEPASSWEALGVEVGVGVAVRRLRPREGAIELTDGRMVRTGRVLLCTGGRPRQLRVAGDAARRVAYLRTIEDALSIRDGLDRRVPVVVVGSGFVGSEVASAAVQRGCQVTVVEADTVPFASVLGRQLGGVLEARHRHQGVRVLSGTTVVSVDGAGETLVVTTASGVRLEAGLVVAGIGMVPATELAEEAGIHVADGIVVDDRCRTSLPSVWAAGDVTAQPIAGTAARGRVEHWRNAQDQGAAAARAMLGDQQPYVPVPWFWSDQYDINLQVAGHPQPTHQLHLRGDAEGESFAGYFLADGVVSAVVGFNRPRDVRTGLRLIERGSSVLPEQVVDESFDLASLP